MIACSLRVLLALGLVDQVRSAVPFSQSFLPVDQDPMEGFTIQELAAIYTGYTNCAECSLAQEYTDIMYAIRFNKKTNVAKQNMK